MFNFLDILGGACVVLSNTVMLPQLYRMIKNKHARDVSLGMLMLSAMMQVLWGTYGYLKGDIAIWSSSVVALVIGSIVLYTYWYYEYK